MKQDTKPTLLKLLLKIPHINRIVIVLLLVLLVDARSFAQKTEEVVITGSFTQLPLSEFLNSLQTRYQVKVFYKPVWVEKYKVTARFENTPLTQALNTIFENHELTWQYFQDNSIVIYRKAADPKLDNQSAADVLVIGNLINVGKFKTAHLKAVIIDGKTGEPLTGAVVFIPALQKGTSSDAKGEFELELPAGDHELQFNFMGFQNSSRKIKLVEDGTATFQLFEETHNIAEVTILGTQNDLPRAQMGMVHMSSAVMKKIPAMMGETDILKGMTMLAGVQSVSELSSGINVRGGNTDQNLILINGSPVFNASHLFGFLSLINPDVVEEVRLFKGGVPIKHGERVSSVMEVGFKEGTTEHIRVYGGIGLINSRLALEGPLTRNKKLTFVTGGRTSYTNWILKEIPDVNISQSVAKFYDLSGKLTWKFNNHNKFSLMGYFSNDEYSTSLQSVNQYSSALGNVSLSNRLSTSLYGLLDFSYSNYKYRLTDFANQNKLEAYYMKNSIEYFSGGYSFKWHITTNQNIDAGIKAIVNKVNPGETEPVNTPTLIESKVLDTEKLVEGAVFVSDEITIGPRFSVLAGLRYVWAGNIGKPVVYLYNPELPMHPDNVTDSLTFGPNDITASYGGFEPRLMLNFDLTDRTSFKLNFQRIRQHTFQLSNAAIVSPAESWKGIDYYIKPIISDQVAMVVENLNSPKTLKLTAELYFKKLQNLVEYKNGAKLLMNENIETALIPTNGYSYGAEFSAEKTGRWFSGYASYVYSVTRQKNTSRFEKENLWNGDYYRSIYDRPHDVTATATLNITRRWRVSGNFVFMSGRPVTLPEIKYEFAGKQLIYYSERNKYRMPPYHRADVSMTLDENLRKKRMWKGSWTLSVYNVYGRENPYSVYYKKSIPNVNNDYRTYSLYRLSVIGVPVPSLTYNFRF